MKKKEKHFISSNMRVYINLLRFPKKKTVPAYALIYAILVLVLISVFSTIYLKLYYFNQKRQSMIFMRQDLRQDTKDALLFLLAQDELKSKGEIDYHHSPLSKFSYKTEPWGIFNRLEIKGERKLFTEKYSTLLGYEIKTDKMPSLYFENSEVLKIGGSTKITKKAILPRKGVERAYINSKEKGNPTLINGKIVKLGRKSKSILKTIEVLKFKPSINENIDNSKIIEYRPDQNYFNSFSNPCILLEIPQGVDINSMIKGHIKIIAEDSLNITNEALIEDVQIICPKVRVKSHFKGNFQVFSTDQIHIEENVHLEYPSVLFLNTDSMTAKLTVEKQSTINGVILANKNLYERGLHSQVEFRKGSMLKGQIITNNLNTQFSGEIAGSVFTNTIFLKTKSSIYTNHLLSTQMDITKLSKYNLGSEIKGFTGQERIINWIDHQSL